MRFIEIHGMARTPTYNSWIAMKKRCCYSGHLHYAKYRGMLCPEWMRSFSAFLRDMGERPSSKHSIERIDNSAGYFPGNCRWATQAEQAINKRNNRIIEWQGRKGTLSQWSRITGINRRTIAMRLDVGWTVEEALWIPAAFVGKNSKSATGLSATA